VNTSGVANNNNANNSNGVVPDCGERQLKVAARPNQSIRAGRNKPASKEGIKAGDAENFQSSFGY